MKIIQFLLKFYNTLGLKTKKLYKIVLFFKVIFIRVSTRLKDFRNSVNTSLSLVYLNEVTEMSDLDIIVSKYVYNCSVQHLVKGRFSAYERSLF